MISLYKWMLLFTFPVLNFYNATKTALAKDLKHPFYVSVIQIDQNVAAKTFEITCKFFADDFEQILEKDYKIQLDMISPKDKAAFDKYIPDYVNRHFRLVVNNKKIILTYIGFEKDKESAYAYFETVNISDVSKINITNSLLYDFTDQEINIMHVTVMGKRQSTKLDYPSSEATFSF